MRKHLLKALALALIVVMACTITSMAAAGDGNNAPLDNHVAEELLGADSSRLTIDPVSDNDTPTKALRTIRNNADWTTAHPYGYWKYMSGDVVQMPNGQDDAFFTFTANAGDRLYVRIGYDSTWTGMLAGLYDANRNLLDYTEFYYTSPLSGLSFVTLDADAISGNQTFFIRILKPENSTAHLYTNITFAERIKTHTDTFSFPGAARNSGYGADSTALTLDLSNDINIPNEAIIRNMTTEGSQSPSQGNVHHKIRSESFAWLTSSVSSSSYGTYPVAIQHGVPVKQMYQFCYNALAYASSTMDDVAMTINYEYDLQNTNYTIF